MGRLSNVSTPINSASPPRTSPTQSKGKGWGLLLIVFVIAGIGGGAWWIHEHQTSTSHAQTSATQVALEPSSDGARTEVVLPTKGGLTRTSTQVGSVHPFQQAALFAKISGYLKWQEVDIGSPVKRGQLLAEIDDPEVVKERDRSKAALKQANAMVEQARAHIKSAEADAQAAAADVTKAEAEVGSFVAARKYRQKELARYEDLRKRDAVPQQIVDEYMDHYETAVARERSAEAAVVSAKAQLTAAKAKVDQAKADFEEAKSNVEVSAENLAKAQVLVDYTKITSPYEGVITLRNFFVGDFIRSAAEGGERPMLTAARTDKMRVVTYIPDRDVPYCDVGDKAIVTLDALPGTKFEGKVARFSYSEVSESRTMRTEVDLENPKGLLREGMYGVATLILETNISNLTIPSTCLTGKAEAGKSSVYVVRNGRAKEVPVKIGIDNGIRIEIIEGLSAQDQVITNPGTVTEGEPVVVEKKQEHVAVSETRKE